MWIPLKLPSYIIAVVFSPEGLTCSWVTEQKQKGKPPFVLRAFKHLPLNAYQVHNLVIFNQSNLEEFIAGFLKQNSLHNPYSVIALNGPGLYEHERILVSDQASPEEFTVPARPSLVWDYQLVHAQPLQHRYWWYACGITREALFGYQLLSIKTSCTCIKITTQTLGLLSAYRLVKPRDIDTPQLDYKQSSLDSTLREYLSTHSLESVLEIAPALCQKIPLGQRALALGLYQAGKYVYERY